MRFLTIVVLLVGTTALMPASACAQPTAEHLFYYVDTEQCLTDLREHAAMISVVSPAWFSADEDGVVWGSVDPRVLAVAKEHAIAVMPLIVNPGFNQEALSRLLHNADARQRAIGSMVDLCVQHRLAGIQFDF